MTARSTEVERLSAEDAAAVFAALSQATRLEAYRLLLRYQPFGLAAGDISRLSAVPHNTLSTHLAVLEAAGLVKSRRESRSIIFVAVPSRFAAARLFLAQGLAHSTTDSRAKAAPPLVFPTRRPEQGMSNRTYNVLLLCTGNSARSIMGEAILNREGHGRFHAFSAGSRPKGKPNPVGIELLASLGYDATGFRSKSWTKFASAGAPRMDFVITVCDAAAGETCPHWPGHPLVAHWGIADPAAVKGTAEQKRAAFRMAYRQLMSRVTTLINLPIESMGLSTLKQQLAEIGRMDGATEMALSRKAA